MGPFIHDHRAMAVPEVTVRGVSEADLPEVNRLYNHYVLRSHATFDLEARTLAAARDWVRALDRTRYPLLIAYRGETSVGFASASRYRPRAAYEQTVETSVYVTPEHTSRGIGAALYEAMLGAIDAAGFHRALAAIALPNDASVRLHERFGFRCVGRLTEVGWKFGRFWDVAWYERGSLTEAPSSPPR